MQLFRIQWYYCKLNHSYWVVKLPVKLNRQQGLMWVCLDIYTISSSVKVWTQDLIIVFWYILCNVSYKLLVISQPSFRLHKLFTNMLGYLVSSMTPLTWFKNGSWVCKVLPGHIIYCVPKIERSTEAEQRVSPRNNASLISFCAVGWLLLLPTVSHLRATFGFQALAVCVFVLFYIQSIQYIYIYFFSGTMLS